MTACLGVDVGATKTHAVLADETGRCLGFGQAGGGNHQSVGYAGLERALSAAVSAACAQAGLNVDQIAGAGFGLAGYDFPSDEAAHRAAIAKLGLAGPVALVNDGLLGLLAGAARGLGVNITSGTSNNCRGRNAAGQEGRVVGNGAAFGEHGGAAEIVQRGLQRVNYAWIRRAPPTALTALYLQATGARDELDLMERLSNGAAQLTPDLAPAVAAAARAGDAGAREVLAWAGEELGWLAVAVARQLGMERAPVEVVLSGSAFAAGPPLVEPLRRLVLAHCPRATLIRLSGPPVIGAVVLGWQAAGREGYALRAHLRATLPPAAGA